MKYLGADIGTSHRRKLYWKPLIDKMEGKLSTWKSESLNEASRLVLARSILDSLPTYWFNICKVPKGVISRLEKIKRNFFWGGKAERVHRGQKETCSMLMEEDD